MYTYTKEIPFNFGLTKNIPLDRRFLFPSLQDAIDMTPVKYRYPGLMFFVMDDGADYQDNTGYLYMWDNDVTTPIKVFDFLMRYCKFGLHFDSAGDYIGDVMRKHLREETYPQLGTMIYLDPIGITLIYTSNNTKDNFMATDIQYYKYCFGDYHFETKQQYIDFPDEYKEPGAVVFIGSTNEKFIIEDNLELSAPIIVYDPPTVFEDFQNGGSLYSKLQEGRYYLVNGILGVCLNGTMYQIGEKIYRRRNMILEKNPEIIHRLNTNFIDAIFVIRNIGTVPVNRDIVNTCHRLETRPVDNNTSVVLNEQRMTGDLFLIALD